MDLSRGEKRSNTVKYTGSKRIWTGLFDQQHHVFAEGSGQRDWMTENGMDQKINAIRMRRETKMVLQTEDLFSGWAQIPTPSTRGGRTPAPSEYVESNHIA